MTIILGGGLSGLSAGYYLAKAISKQSTNLSKIFILEASERCGGWVDSTDKSSFIFEAGPRTIRPKGPQGMNTLSMIEDLGLTEKVIPILPDHAAAKNRLIYANKKLHVLPSGLSGAMKTKGPFSKPLISALFHDWKTKPHLNLKDDTMYNFVERRFGKELADYAISPMLCGICAGDAKEISVKFLLGPLFDLEQQYGGIVKGALKSAFDKKNRVVPRPVTSALVAKSKKEKWNIYALKGGLEELPKKLKESLLEVGCTIYTDHKVNEITFYDDNQKVRVKLRDDYSFCSEHLISSIPAYELATLFEKQHPYLTEELLGIPFVDVAVVNLHYDSTGLLQHDAFGFLVPPLEKLPILGVIYDSCCFPTQDGTVLTVMMGGKWFKEYFGDNPTEDKFFNVAKDQLKNILNINIEPKEYKVNILHKCIPQYIVGHHERVTRIRGYISKNKLPASLCGSSYDGIGVNDVVLSALKAVEKEYPDVCD